MEFLFTRSRRFLDIILQNIEAIEYANVEIIISDRHLYDDAIQVLKQRFGRDSRFRFLEAADGLNWVGNFNLLLREARGEYFVCMAHDDSFPSTYIPSLVTALEERPDAIFAFGYVDQLSVDGFLPTFPTTPPPISPDGDWSIACSLRLLSLWQLWIAFRGMIRREAVIQSNLYVRETYRNIRADIYWLFGVSLKGRLHYVPNCRYTKRFYQSAQARTGDLESARVLTRAWFFVVTLMISRSRVVTRSLARSWSFPGALFRASCRLQLPDEWGIVTRQCLLKLFPRR